MRRYARRKDMMPIACAVALSVAAGLALAEEHAWEPGAPSERAVAPADLSNKAAPGTKGTAGNETARPNERGVDGVATGDGDQPKGGRGKQGVGSRALTGNAARERAADQPLMATGVDLNGPPVRFPAADTPGRPGFRFWVSGVRGILSSGP